MSLQSKKDFTVELFIHIWGGSEESTWGLVPAGSAAPAEPARWHHSIVQC
jgi:hypothetical protein